MNLIKYYFRDAKEGIQRNLGAALATILLMVITLTLSGLMYIVKAGVDDVVDYLDKQVSMKLFLTPDTKPEAVANILKTKSFTKDVTIETKEETLARFETLFQGKEYLFQAFQDSSFPDAIRLEVNDTQSVSAIATELKKVKGIDDVVYAQSFAQSILKWEQIVNSYGLLFLGVLAVTAWLTISLTMTLSMHQRQKDIRIKLLLGAKISHVRSQFLLEGGILGIISGVITSLLIYVVYYYGIYEINTHYSFLFDPSTFSIGLVMTGVVLFGIAVGISGSWFATRKMMRYA